MESSHLQKLIVILNPLRLGWWLGLVKHSEELVAFDATVHNDATAVLDTLRISRDRKSSSELLIVLNAVIGNKLEAHRLSFEYQ